MKIAAVVVAALFLSGCVTTEAADKIVKKSYHGHASWYKSGKKTANGERFNPHGVSVAHRYLPFGTVLRITHVGNGNTIEAVVNDRGPFIKGREIDVSLGAAQKLGFVHSGTAKVLIEVLEKP